MKLEFKKYIIKLIMYVLVVYKSSRRQFYSPKIFAHFQLGNLIKKQQSKSQFLTAKTSIWDTKHYYVPLSAI